MTATLTQPRPGIDRTKPHISASQLKSYSMCSLKWWFSRKYKAEETPGALVFGKAFHAALQGFYQARLEDRTVGHADLMAIFATEYETELLPIQYGKTDSKDSQFETADRMLAVFLDRVRPGKVVGVEEPFSCELADDVPPLVGAIDLMEIVTGEDGIERLHLVDFKTAGKKPSEGSEMDPDQLTLYAVAAYRTGLLDAFKLPFVLRYEIITKTKTPEVFSQTVTPDRHEALRLIEKARVIWRGMKDGIAFPEPGWQCSGCGFAARCKAWPEGL